MKKLAIKTSVWLSGLMPVTAFAADVAEELPADAPETLGGLLDIIRTIAVWMYNILLALGVVFVLYAAFLYLVSQGNEDRISNAKRVLIYAIVALVIGVLAGGVSNIVTDFITTGGS